MRACDIALPGLDDAEHLTGLRDPDAIASFYLELGARIVVVKMGRGGALAATPKDRERIYSHAVQCGRRDRGRRLLRRGLSHRICAESAIPSPRRASLTWRRRSRPWATARSRRCRGAPRSKRRWRREYNDLCQRLVGGGLCRLLPHPCRDAGRGHGPFPVADARGRQGAGLRCASGRERGADRPHLCRGARPISSAGGLGASL